jgi:hypothetical protein
MCPPKTNMRSQTIIVHCNKKPKKDTDLHGIQQLIDALKAELSSIRKLLSNKNVPKPNNKKLQNAGTRNAKPAPPPPPPPSRAPPPPPAPPSGKNTPWAGRTLKVAEPPKIVKEKAPEQIRRYQEYKDTYPNLLGNWGLQNLRKINKHIPKGANNRPINKVTYDVLFEALQKHKLSKA